MSANVLLEAERTKAWGDLQVAQARERECVVALRQARTHHEACMRLAWREHEQAQADRQAASSARRSAAGKARHARSRSAILGAPGAPETATATLETPSSTDGSV